MADTRLESNDADVQGEFAKGRGLHVEKVSHLTNTEDHEEGVVQAIKNQPWVVAWSGMYEDLPCPNNMFYNY